MYVPLELYLQAPTFGYVGSWHLPWIADSLDWEISISFPVVQLTRTIAVAVCVVVVSTSKCGLWRKRKGRVRCSLKVALYLFFFFFSFFFCIVKGSGKYSIFWGSSSAVFVLSRLDPLQPSRRPSDHASERCFEPAPNSTRQSQAGKLKVMQHLTITQTSHNEASLPRPNDEVSERDAWTDNNRRSRAIVSRWLAICGVS
jgi:hypothetical protein